MWTQRSSEMVSCRAHCVFSGRGLLDVRVLGAAPCFDLASHNREPSEEAQSPIPEGIFQLSHGPSCPSCSTCKGQHDCQGMGGSLHVSLFILG